MAWIAVDKSGKVYMYRYKPIRDWLHSFWFNTKSDGWTFILQDNHVINMGLDYLTWDDEPVEI